MVTSKQLHRLATHPAEMARFQMTGRVPRGVTPSSPLITLLERIGPRDLGRITGVTVDERLGYAGSRTFQFAAQALRWVKPDAEVFGSFAAESWRMKAFAKVLTAVDLAACCAQFPADLLPKAAASEQQPVQAAPTAARSRRP